MINVLKITTKIVAILFFCSIVFYIFLVWINNKIATGTIEELNKYPESFKIKYYNECSKFSERCDCEIDYLEHKYKYSDIDKSFDEDSVKYKEAYKACLNPK